MGYVKWLKIGAVIFGSAGLGGAAGWFFTKRHYEKAMDEKIQEEVRKEVQASKEFLEGKNDCDEQGNVYVTETNVDENEKIVLDTETPAKDIHRETAKEKFERKWPNWEQREKEREEFMKNPIRIRYDKVGVEEKPPIDIRDFDLNQAVDDGLLRQNSDDPSTEFEYPSGEELAANRYGYSDETLYWWPREKLLTEMDLSILDVPDILGPRWEEHMGEYDVDTLYVINHNNKTCYDVIAQDGSLYDLKE